MRVAFALIAALVLAGCGTEDEDPGTDSGVDSGADAGGNDAGGNDTGSGCDGVDPSRGCLDTPCAFGETCVQDDSACAPSACSCDLETGSWMCTADCGPGWVCAPETTSCTTPDPSRGCLDGGCPSGQTCVSDDSACAPSTCACDDASGTWACSEDCGPGNVCVPDDPACAAEAPEPGAACSAGQEGTTCEYGSECCCGGCSASYGCVCDGGSWACYATDACFIESCAGRACDNDTDCEGGGYALACVDGVCEDVPPASSCFGATDRGTCDGTPGCEWMYPPGCFDEGDEVLAEAGCFPSFDCGAMGGEMCPVGSACVENVAVSPRCAFEEPLCDACLDYRGLCYATR